MSSDIWRPHPHYHHQQQLNFLSGNSNRSKRSRSVLAMPNHSSELSAAAAAATRQTTQLKLAEQNNLTSRRPTYCGQTSTATTTTGNNYEMQQQQQLSMEEDLIDGQQQVSGAGKHAGPMGIFFKVWSLVKVTKGRHQQRQQQRQLQHHTQQIQNGAHSRLRRQASEDNSNYSADFALGAAAANSSRQVNILQDKHFRRAGSQPASSLVDRLQVRNSAAANATTTIGSSCTSSGVSSTTSSTLAANSGNSPTTSSSSSPFQRRSFGGLAIQKSAAKQEQQQQQQQQQESWVSRMRNSNRARATSAAAIARRRHSGQQQQLLSLSLSTSDGSRSSSELRDEPEEYENELDEEDDDEVGGGERDEEDEEESNDIYSTPNDSIQSVPSGQRALVCNGERPQTFNPISKSFSTNNFHQLHQQQQQQQTNNKSTIAAAAEQQDNSDKNNNNNNNNNNINKRPTLNGSRFFISSSSSEDSQPTKQQPAQQQQQQPPLPAKAEQQQQQTSGVVSSKQRVSLNQGVHTHLGPARPQSLLLSDTVVYGQDPTISQFLVPVQMLTPVGGALPSTTTAAAVPTNVYLGTRLKSPSIVTTGGYQRSPSLFEFPQQNTRFSSKYPPQVSSFQQQQQQLRLGRAPAPPGGPISSQSRQSVDSNSAKFSMPNSISMFDFKQANNTNANNDCNNMEQKLPKQQERIEERSEYKLAEMMLESGSNPNARDQQGNTTLMLACLSDNLSAVKCLIEHGANLNETNSLGLGPLDLVCMRQANSTRLEMLKILIDNGVDLDRQSTSDGSRLLDRLIKEHQSVASATSWSSQDKMAFIECLLESGAKLSSSTWLAAQGKLEVQLCLLRKLCQDGYFLYKQASIEAAVYRFEYALKRIAELEQQLAWARGGRKQSSAPHLQLRTGVISPEGAALASRKIKYQTYLGLSRCERKRKFFKRALEFAQLAILVDSSSYEAFYSKAHILKDLGETDDSLLTIDQTARLIERTIENLALELKYLDQQEESLIMDNCFDLDRESSRQQSNLLAKSRLEIQGTVDYLLEARKFVARLRQDILADKFRSNSQNRIKADDDDNNYNKEAILST